MAPLTVILVIVIYFGILIVISAITGKNATNDAFFLGNKKSPWFIVAFGMIGTSLSGVTFISVPGWVGASQFSYMQMVLGYLLGYAVISFILIPLYYKMNLTSIYTYLEHRFGKWSYKSGAFFFLISRTFGAAARLFIVATVLQLMIFDAWNIPFILTVIVTILLIWLYTFKAGIKTIVWTDSLQTFFMLLAVIVSVILIANKLDLNFKGLVNTITDSEYSKMLFFRDFAGEKAHFLKHFLGGAFIAIAMTGLDQDMMQKNLSCKNIGDAQKNVMSLSFVLIFVNLLFLSLGVLLFTFAEKTGINLPAHSDDLFPLIATKGYLSPVLSVIFLIGIIAAAFSSADSALTALTTSFTVDIIGIKNKNERQIKRTRKRVHVFISVILILVIIGFKLLNNKSVIDAVFTIAGYTYGPLLGLYAFGLFTKYKVKDKFVPFIAILSPLIVYLININIENWLGYKFGFELLIFNGLVSFFLLWCIRKNQTSYPSS
ncbi:sodium:solute symporter [Bacteroidota bacterium]